jgi:hypothetical protein
MPRKQPEKDYYVDIKERLEKLFKDKGTETYFEITAEGTFSNTLKSKVPHGREIIFSFLKKKLAPDITGFVKTSISSGFVVVEVKKDKIELDNLYQLKKYADLFEAKFAFLVSLKPIPEELKRLLGSPILLLPRLKYGIYQAFVLAHFDENKKDFVEWFEENPFTETIYWK